MRLLRERRGLQDALIVGSALLLTALYVAAAGGGFALDDAWIHQTYARNLGLLGEWAFVPGVPSAASTSPLYTVLLALGYRLGVPYALWAHGLGALALAATGLLAARMARRVSRPESLVPLAAGLACVWSWHLIWAAASGMETALFSALTLALILLAWRESDGQGRRPLLRAALFGLTGALLMLTRPEGVVLLALASLALLLARPGRSTRAMLGWLFIAGVVWLLAMLPYFALNLSLAGGLLPSTNAAKQAEYAVHFEAPYVTRVLFVLQPLLAGGTALLLPGFTAFGWVRGLREDRMNWLYLLPVAWVLALPLLYGAWLPVNYHYGRYVIPILPSLLTCGVIGTAWLLERFAAGLIGRTLTRVLVVSALVVLPLFALLLGLNAYVIGVTIIDDEMVDPAQWIAANLPPEDLMAVHDIGAVGYFASRPILDTAGLVSPEVIPVMHDQEGLYALFAARGVRFFMAFDDQTPGGVADDPRLCPRYRSEGDEAVRAGGSKMTVYALAYDGRCPP